MKLAAQTAPWYDRLATQQEGYYYPWQSHLPAWHGEDVYLEMVRQHLRPDTDVLDAACGHGEIALIIAPHVRSVLAYDRTASWIELAQRRAAEQGIINVTFICHDSSAVANNGHAHIPAEGASFDLLLCSKGPFHWIEDARRVARPGGILLMLVPDAVARTPWRSLLPESLQWMEATNANWARESIERRLGMVGLSIDSWWSFDVPETFPDPEQLYVWLTFGATPEEVPSFREVRSILERVFMEHGGQDGVSIRRRRSIWKAVTPR